MIFALWWLSLIHFFEKKSYLSHELRQVADNFALKIVKTLTIKQSKT